eukprot:EG_transcript_10163
MAAVASSLGISATLVAWVLVKRHASIARVLQSAPGGVIAVMFTDLHITTALWDRYPEAMSWTLNQYSRIIRSLLAEFGGYEVKTIGDAFMVVFQEPSQALQCAIRIQEDLLQQHWPLELQQEEACSTKMDLDGRLIWNGPRVCASLHSGAPDLTVNRQRGRVDYQGPVISLAARVESKACGGQTLITEDVRRLIPEAILSQYDIHSTGKQYFKEINRTLELFSILPFALAMRVFTPPQENVCHRCEGTTACPRCDAVLDHGLQPPAQPSPSQLRPSLQYSFQRSHMMVHAEPQLRSGEDLL